MLILFTHTKLHTHWCCKKAIRLCCLGASNTWPGVVGYGENGGIREQVMNWPGDAGKEWQTAASPSGLCHRSASVSLGPPSNKDRPHRGCQCVCVLHVCVCTCVYLPMNKFVCVWMWSPLYKVYVGTLPQFLFWIRAAIMLFNASTWLLVILLSMYNCYYYAVNCSQLS